MARKTDELAHRAERIKDGWQFRFRILIKKEDDLWVAHCLELDLVANAPSKEQVQKEIVNVIIAQVRYCLVHDNMDYLFRRAPEDVWEEYNACRQQDSPKLIIKKEVAIPAPKKKTLADELPPVWFTAKACWAPIECHA